MDSRGNESDYHISGHAPNSCFNNIYFGAFYAIATAIIVLAVSALLAIYTLKIRKPRVAKTKQIPFSFSVSETAEHQC